MLIPLKDLRGTPIFWQLYKERHAAWMELEREELQVRHAIERAQFEADNPPDPSKE